MKNIRDLLENAPKTVKDIYDQFDPEATVTLPIDEYFTFVALLDINRHVFRDNPVAGLLVDNGFERIVNAQPSIEQKIEEISQSEQDE